MAFDAIKSAWLAELHKQKARVEKAVAQVPDNRLHTPIAPGKSEAFRERMR